MSYLDSDFQSQDYSTEKKKKNLKSKFGFYFCHWCKKKYLRRKWKWKHEDKCLDNPVVIKRIRILNNIGKTILKTNKIN